MYRRRYLVTGGLGFATGGYLAWEWWRSPTIPEGMNVETLHLREDILTEQSARDSDYLDWKEQYHMILQDEETAATELIATDSLITFVENTDFNRSYIVVIQNGMQSQPDLVLDAIKREEYGIHIEISIDAPRAVNDDLRTHSLLIRITDEKDEIPEAVTVDIEGYT